MFVQRRGLTLPGVELEPCKSHVMIQDSRGQVFIGLFAGYSSAFIALSDPCDCDSIKYFINIRRVNVIRVIQGGCAEKHNDRGGPGTGSIHSEDNERPSPQANH